MAADPDPAGWFERLYAAAEQGEATVPWDRGGRPNPVLERWTRERRLEGDGRRALVVGSGFGDDAEHVARLGFATVAFDFSPTAIRLARRRFPASAVEYVTADLLDPPAEWRQAFDLVVESLTAQSLPDPPRREAIAQIGRMLAPGGTLIVIAAIHDDADGPGPPWPLTRAEVEAFASDGVTPVAIDVVDAAQPGEHRWQAEFTRPAPGAGGRT
jgi:SAM-dependent methyltransferase